MVKVVYVVKNGGKVYETASYKEAQKGNIIETKYEPIKEEWAENAVKALIKHRKQYRGY